MVITVMAVAMVLVMIMMN